VTSDGRLIEALLVVLGLANDARVSATSDSLGRVGAKILCVHEANDPKLRALFSIFAEK
jgi:hypothetical protein